MLRMESYLNDVLKASILNEMNKLFLIAHIYQNFIMQYGYK